MKRIHVLLGIDPQEDGLLVQVLGQGELAEDAVDGGVGIELVHQGLQLGLGGGLGQLVGLGVEAYLLAGSPLVADVDLGGGVGAYDDDSQSGGDSRLGDELLGIFLDLPANGGGDGFSVNDVCHGWSPLLIICHPERSRRATESKDDR